MTDNADLELAAPGAPVLYDDALRETIEAEK